MSGPTPADALRSSFVSGYMVLAELHQSVCRIHGICWVEGGNGLKDGEKSRPAGSFPGCRGLTLY